MARKKIQYRRQRAGRSPVLRQLRSSYVRPTQLRIRVNIGRYQQPTSVARQPELNLWLIRKGILLLVLILLFTLAVRWGFRTLERSGVFSVHRVTVQGNRMSNEVQIRALADIQQGVQLFDVTAEEIAERIRQHPWIDQVEVERVWPDTLTVRVTEHRPLAMINIEGEQEGLYYLDDRGTVFVSVDPLQDIDYPVVTGVSPPDGKSAGAGFQLGGDARTGEVCEFLHVAARGNPILPLQSISEVHLEREKGIIVYLVEHPFPIYIGYGNVERRYYQLVKLLERLYRKETIEGIREIRMDYHDGRILVARSEP
ncbi:MAG: FtsQ-type POTRA domain-containing protein [Candidatus Electrothrix sp. AUS1_2]|nr:FtsQ-type POTRA domain-containing protein [Candidatus Electrothrix sp. AUS1_2]